MIGIGTDGKYGESIICTLIVLAEQGRARSVHRPGAASSYRPPSASPPRLSLASRIGIRRSPERRLFNASGDRYRPRKDEAALVEPPGSKTAPRVSLNDRITSASRPPAHTAIPSVAYAPLPGREGVITPPPAIPKSAPSPQTSLTLAPMLSAAPREAGLPPRPIESTAASTPPTGTRHVRQPTSTSQAVPITANTDPAPPTATSPTASAVPRAVPPGIKPTQPAATQTNQAASSTHAAPYTANTVAEDEDIKPIIVVDDSAPTVQSTRQVPAPIAAKASKSPASTMPFPRPVSVSTLTQLPSAQDGATPPTTSATRTSVTTRPVAVSTNTERPMILSQVQHGNSEAGPSNPRPQPQSRPSTGSAPASVAEVSPGTNNSDPTRSPSPPQQPAVSKGKKRRIEEEEESAPGPSRRPEYPKQRRAFVAREDPSSAGPEAAHARASQRASMTATIPAVRVISTPPSLTPLSTFVNPSGLPMSFYVAPNALKLHTMVEESIVSCHYPLSKLLLHLIFRSRTVESFPIQIMRM